MQGAWGKGGLVTQGWMKWHLMTQGHLFTLVISSDFTGVCPHPLPYPKLSHVSVLYKLMDLKKTLLIGQLSGDISLALARALHTWLIQGLEQEVSLALPNL